MIHSLAERAGVPLVSIHQFRHTCASDLIESGVSLPNVQKILGHAVITTRSRDTPSDFGSREEGRHREASDQ